MTRHFLPSRRALGLACLSLLTGLLNGCGGDDGRAAIPLSISTLSSRAGQVSDSAARLAVTVTPNVAAQEMRWRSNGQALNAQVVSRAATAAQVLVQGLALGSNALEAHVPDGRATGSVTLVNEPAAVRCSRASSWHRLSAAR